MSRPQSIDPTFAGTMHHTHSSSYLQSCFFHPRILSDTWMSSLWMLSNCFVFGFMHSCVQMQMSVHTVTRTHTHLCAYLCSNVFIHAYTRACTHRRRWMMPARLHRCTTSSNHCRRDMRPKWYVYGDMHGMLKHTHWTPESRVVY